MKSKRLLIAACFIASVFLLIYPCKVLVAEHYFGRVASILDDLATDHLDVADISEEMMPAYRNAVENLRKSVALVPSQPAWKALFDVYLRLGEWAGVMEHMGEPLPEEAFSKDEAYGKALESLTAALDRDPLNADCHLAMAQLYQSASSDGNMVEKELDAAVCAMPHNAALRHVVATRYLLLGNKAKALEHAAALAQIDDQYIIGDSPGRRLMAERRTPEYLNLLSRSYLAKSLEIAWRASKRNIETVRSVVPDNGDAKQVLALFMEWKGMEE